MKYAYLSLDSVWETISDDEQEMFKRQADYLIDHQYLAGDVDELAKRIWLATQHTYATIKAETVEDGDNIQDDSI